MKRVYLPYTKWECFQNGMYEDNAKQLKEWLVRKCVKLLSSNAKFSFACYRVISEWENSCSVHLCNENMNRLAYMGQAACCLLFGAHKYTTCEAWNRLSEKQQKTANDIAQKAIDKWSLKQINNRNMPKIKLDKNVLEACQERVSWTFDTFNKVYVSFSGGKDSTVMLHIVMQEAIKRNRKVGLLFIDLEGQYEATINHVKKCYDMYKDYIYPYWVCLPIHLRNAVSVFETHWVCWEQSKKESWVRQLPENCINDESFFPFFRHGMEFEEFVPLFGDWYGEGEETACFVGIRTDESLNRWRTIASKTKKRKNDRQYTTLVSGTNTYNIYPIYDWKTQDLWVYHGKNLNMPYNHLYDLMYKAGLSINQMRICQPYGDDQRRGLWLFHIIEPETWNRVVARVNGANGGALYISETGNINGYRSISKPPNHTWQTFSRLLLESMPQKTKLHYENKISVFVKWWVERGYESGIPDEADPKLEAARKVPSWRRVCKSLLRNDYWCKGMSFTQHKTEAYNKYLKLMEARREKWANERPELFATTN